jgi:probable phosphoglycerate mutase
MKDDHLETPNVPGDAHGLRVVLVRTAETPFSRQGRFEGDIDLPLTDRGRQSCRRLLAEVLRPLGVVDTVYASGNQGSRETAEILAAANSNRIRVLSGLRGVSFGLWEGQLISDVRQRHRRIFLQWQRQPNSITPPEGEKTERAIKRTLATVRNIMKRHRTGTVCIVAPRMVIALIYCHLRSIDPERVFEAGRNLGRVEVVMAQAAR